MAFFNDLVRTIAAVEGMDEMTVRGIGIRIRDGGYISKSGRGLSAAQMNNRDKANLLIGVNASDTAIEAGDSVGHYRNLRLAQVWPPRPKFKGVIKDVFSSNRTFGSVMEDIVEFCASPISDMDVLGHHFTNGFNFKHEVLTELDDASGFDEVITVALNFRKPEKTATIELKSADADQIYLNVQYGLPSKEATSDRRDVTTITQKTLRAVGQLV
ncbi:hypothetical protein MKK84_17210 [Methylobacterium sp. E-065]|uniref:hypothetical protein n=1 Tax=Methylobacterium sp. E-065 TaxID=2836583 RepID=UPI001FBA8AB5|nr:hypothetical protein [Methylobacterium sp. E-065]MCJ2019162.1 hypothetical protein [Methylobacterium sp. E-065]